MDRLRERAQRRLRRRRLRPEARGRRALHHLRRRGAERDQRGRRQLRRGRARRARGRGAVARSPGRAAGRAPHLPRRQLPPLRCACTPRSPAARAALSAATRPPRSTGSWPRSATGGSPAICGARRRRAEHPVARRPRRCRPPPASPTRWRSTSSAPPRRGCSRPRDRSASLLAGRWCTGSGPRGTFAGLVAAGRCRTRARRGQGVVDESDAARTSASTAAQPVRPAARAAVDTPGCWSWPASGHGPEQRVLHPALAPAAVGWARNRQRRRGRGSTPVELAEALHVLGRAVREQGVVGRRAGAGAGRARGRAGGRVGAHPGPVLAELRAAHPATGRHRAGRPAPPSTAPPAGCRGA